MITKTEPADHIKRPLHHPTLSTYTFHIPSLISYMSKTHQIHCIHLPVCINF